MSSPNDLSASQRIAEALARLRPSRPAGPRGPFGPAQPFAERPHEASGPHAPGAPHGPHASGAPHGRYTPHGDRVPGGRSGAFEGPGGPFRLGEHGPFGRFAARFRLLEALTDASAPLSVSEIAQHIGVDQPRASRLVQSCADDGFVAREADPDDARRTRVALTDRGRAIVARERGARVGAVDEALAAFSDEEREQLATLLARLADAWPR